MSKSIEDIFPSHHEYIFTFSRSSGPGGQNVNKVNSKAQLRWNPGKSPTLPQDIKARFLESFQGRLTNDGDLLLFSDRYRDRIRNQEDCLEKLRVLLHSVFYAKKIRRKTKPSKNTKSKNLDKKTKHKEKKRNRSYSGGQDY